MPTLALVHGGQVIATYPLDRPVVVVGRDNECDIALAGPIVSRKHCRLVASGDTYVVEDLGSHNGTYLNGVRVERQTLVQGDEIAVVPHILVYHASVKEPLAAPASPGGEASTDLAGTMEVDPAEVRRRLAELRGGAEPRGLELSHEAVGSGVDLVKVSGPLDGRTSDRLGKVVKALLAQGRRRIVIDMAEASHLTKEGVGVLLWAADKAEASGGKLVLLNPAGQVQGIPAMALAERFTMARDRQEALSILQPAG